MGDPEAGIAPTLFIYERCRLIECLPALQHDPNHPEDVLKVDTDEEGVPPMRCAIFSPRSRPVSSCESWRAFEGWILELPWNSLELRLFANVLADPQKRARLTL
jgi:hypothetical protein